MTKLPAAERIRPDRLLHYTPLRAAKGVRSEGSNDLRQSAGAFIVHLNSLLLAMNCVTIS
jgi:hypothetical protein